MLDIWIKNELSFKMITFSQFKQNYFAHPGKVVSLTQRSEFESECRCFLLLVLPLCS